MYSEFGSHCCHEKPSCVCLCRNYALSDITTWSIVKFTSVLDSAWLVSSGGGTVGASGPPTFSTVWAWPTHFLRSFFFFFFFFACHHRGPACRRTTPTHIKYKCQKIGSSNNAVSCNVFYLHVPSKVNMHTSLTWTSRKTRYYVQQSYPFSEKQKIKIKLHSLLRRLSWMLSMTILH